MSIWGAFTDSVQAMNAQSQSLGAISQNISNVNTNGYKKTDTQFATMLSEVTPPANIFGVRAQNRQMIDVQGVVGGSSKWSDVSLSGKGFFVVNSQVDGSGQTFYTRDGAFGEKVLDPTLTKAAATATATKAAAGTGSATATTFQQADGTTNVNTAVSPAATTLQAASNPTSYLTDASGNFIMGWKATNGVIAPGTTLTAMGYQLGTTVLGSATTKATLKGTVPSSAAVSDPTKAWSPTASVGVPVYQQYTNAQNKTDFQVQTLQMQWTKTGADTWAVSFAVDPKVGTVTPAGPPAANGQPAPATTVTFDGNGNFLSQTGTATAAITWANGTSSNITVDPSKLTQLASSSFQVDGTTQDGSANSTLAKVTFDTQGRMVGNFTNGKDVLLGQVSIATFAAPNSLEERSGNLFVQTAAAGARSVNTVKALGGQTALQPESLEGSNVTMEDEFTKMITTQKAYSSASKVFQTADEMTTSIRDLIR